MNNLGHDRLLAADNMPTSPPLPLIDALRASLASERDAGLQQWQRALPVGDYLSDRWEKAKSLGFGEGASVYDNALVLGKVNVGANTWIGPFTVLDGTGGLVIGAYCSISAGVQIYTHDTVAWATSGGLAAIERQPVSIGDRCYIGPNAIISKGVKIGSGCIIGANSFVNQDIPDGMKAWGTPARCIGPVTDSAQRGCTF